MEYNPIVKALVKKFHKEWFFSHSGNDANTTIPFEIINGWLVIKVTLNNSDSTSYNFIVDTGAMTTINSDLAEKLNLEKIRGLKSTDLNNVRSQSSLVKVPQIEIGERKFFNVGVVSTKVDFFRCFNISGIIGLNLLHDIVFNVDYLKKTISIFSAIDTDQISSFNVCPIEVDWKKNMYLKATLDGKKTKLLIDTGSPDFILLNNSTLNIRKASILYKKLTCISAAHSVKHDSIHFVEIPNIELNHTALGKHVVIYYGNKALIGNGFFLECNRVVFDFKNSRIFFDRPNVAHNDEKYRSIDLSWMDGRVRISGLLKDKEIERLGINLNDPVEAINGIDVTSLNSQCELMAFEKEHQIYDSGLELIVSNNGIKKIYKFQKSNIFR